MRLVTLEEHRRSIETRYGEISYLDVGDGPPAVFVHGVFLNGLLWRNLIGEVAEERRCLAIDLPVHGKTRVSRECDLGLPAQAEMLEALCAALALDAIDLVANDTGGAIAQIFAVRQPHRLRTLTLTNCDTHDNLPPPAFRPTVELAAEGKLAPLVEQMAASPDVARSPAGLGAGYEHPENLGDDVVRAYLGPFSTPEARRELERFLTSVRAEDLIAIEPDLRKLEVPTLIVWGTGDPFFEISWAHWLRDTIPGTEAVVEVEGGKLFFPDERARELAVPLRKHWARHRPNVSADRAAARKEA